MQSNIWEELARSRKRAEYLAQKKEETFMKAHPRLTKINLEIKKNYLDLLALSLNSKNDASKKLLEDRIEKLKQEKSEFLNQFPPNQVDFEAKYDCPYCDDTGYQLTSTGNKRLCACVIQKQMRWQAKKTGIQQIQEVPSMQKTCFDLYDDQELHPTFQITQRQNMKRIYQKMQEYVNQFSLPVQQNLIFHGPNGQGKTHLCYVMAKSLLDRGFTVFYSSAYDLFELLNTKQFNRKELSEEEISKSHLLLTADVLLLDDLGTEKMTSFTIADLFGIINQRGIDKKATLLSTNLTRSGIERTYGQRVMSRLIENYAFIPFFGPDVRMTLRK